MAIFLFAGECCREKEEERERKKSRQKGMFAPSTGLGPTLRERSAARRENQLRLTALSDRPLSATIRNDLLPDLHIEYLPAGSLKSASRRMRKSDELQAARLDRSIAEFGVCLPILIDSDRRIIHGHGIWEAAKRASLDTVPTIEVAHLSPSKQRALAIALNRLGETGTRDELALAEEFNELIELDEDIVVTGFDIAEIDALLLYGGTADGEPDAVPSPLVMPISKPGDLWQLGDHLLLQGDALDPASYERHFASDQSVRFVFTDIPFNVPNRGHTTSKKHHREFAVAHGELSSEQFSVFNTTWMKLASSRPVDGGLLATFIDWRSIEVVLIAALQIDLDRLNIVVWNKTNGGQGSLWRSQHELLPVFKKGTAPHINNVKLGRHGRWRSNVWIYPGGSSLGSDARSLANDHPTVKPRAMLEDALLDVTNRGDSVPDPFLGSGSTLCAAETTGRKCRAIEIDSRYCDVTIERWQLLTGRNAVNALEVRAAIRAEIHKDNPATVILDERGVGMNLCQDLRRQFGLIITGSTETDEPIERSGTAMHRRGSSKIERFGRASLEIADGRAMFPNNADWLESFLNELTSFPSVPEKDQVDSMCQVIGNFDAAVSYARQNVRRRH